MFLRSFALVPWLALATGHLAAAQSFTPGNLLVTFNEEVREYTMDGELIQTVSVPENPAGFAEVVRDLVLDDNGVLHVYNGTYDPILHTLRAGWYSHAHEGWSTVNNVSYGGIAVIAGLVFVTDMQTPGDGSTQGIVRFDTRQGFASVRFAAVQYIDLNIGLDCLLYALRLDQETLDVFDPLELTYLGTISLANDVRGVAITGSGHIFGASWDGNVYHFDGNGSLVKSTGTGYGNLTDINLNRDGELVVGVRSEIVVLTSTALDSVSSFEIPGIGTTFVAHAGGEACVSQDPVFADGFESGDTTSWSDETP